MAQTTSARRWVWVVPGLAAGLVGLIGFEVAHSLLIPWANPRFLFGASLQGIAPALVGGLAAAWLYARLSPRLPSVPARAVGFGIALWMPIIPFGIAALAFGPLRADAGSAPAILGLLLLVEAATAAVGWRYVGDRAGAIGAVLATLPGAMFIGGGALDAVNKGAAGGLLASTVITYGLAGAVLGLLVQRRAARAEDIEPATG